MKLILIDESPQPLKNMVGQPAAAIDLPDENGQNWSLSERLGKITVLLFYPQNETFVCNRQLCSVRDHWNQYLATGAEVVAISASTPADNKVFAGKYELPFRLLTDENKKITKQYIKSQFLPLNWTRGIVVIDAEGIIRYRKILLKVFRPSDHKVLNVIKNLIVEARYARRKSSKDSLRFSDLSTN